MYRKAIPICSFCILPEIAGEACKPLKVVDLSLSSLFALLLKIYMAYQKKMAIGDWKI